MLSLAWQSSILHSTLWAGFSVSLIAKCPSASINPDNQLVLPNGVLSIGKCSISVSFLSLYHLMIFPNDLFLTVRNLPFTNSIVLSTPSLLLIV